MEEWGTGRTSSDFTVLCSVLLRSSSRQTELSTSWELTWHEKRSATTPQYNQPGGQLDTNRDRAIFIAIDIKQIISVTFFWASRWDWNKTLNSTSLTDSTVIKNRINQNNPESSASCICLSLSPNDLLLYSSVATINAPSLLFLYSTVALVPPMSTMNVWRGIT